MPMVYPTSDLQDFAKQLRQVLHEQLLPLAQAAETRGFLCQQAWQRLAASGLLALPHQGAGFLRSAVFLEELGALGYAGIRASIGVHAYMACSYLELFGNEEQRQRYLPRIRQGQLIAALAISEEQAGSDLSHMRSQVSTSPEGYLLEGGKRYIANGSQAGLFVTLARSSESGHALGSASLLLIDSDSRGLSCRPTPMLGWRSGDICDLDFQQVPVPAHNLLGKPGKALFYLMQCLEFERLVAGFLALGGANHSIDLVLAFTRRHTLHGAPLCDRQSVKHRLSDLISEQQLVRNYAYQLAIQHCQGQLDSRSACILKLRATELALNAAQACAQLHGARGYQEHSPVARTYRDAMAGTIAAGASELMRDMIFDSTSWT